MSSATNLSSDDLSSLVFPQGFEFGLSSSCNQTEGAVTEGKKGVSIWDTFTQLPGSVVDGSTQATAIDHYNRYKDDFALLGEIGPGSYRPSIAWSRIEPIGDGVWNQEGLDYYSNVVDELLEHGIEPWITLYHWDMPQALQDRGGWENRDTAYKFRDFAVKVQECLGDRVKRWTTFEEPWCVSFHGYASGRHAPGITDPGAALRAAHNVLLGHGLAATAMKTAQPDHSVGIALNMGPIEASSSAPEDIDTARRVDLMANHFFIEAIMLGRHSVEALGVISRYTDSSHMREGDLEIIAAPLDYLGINYYFREYAKWDPSNPNRRTPHIGCEDVAMVPSGRPKTLYGWEINHQGLYDLLMRVHYAYPSIPLYIAEAGASFDDRVDSDGAVHDERRIDYLRGQLMAARDAIRSGVDLRGFCVWTFLDNWEWAMGWSQRFGLVYVDHETLERRPKDSAAWFRDLIRANAGEAPMGSLVDSPAIAQNPPVDHA